ncbi:MAG TPA: hypothetical protein VLO11_04515 [Luteolibacter sp.]|nr:hypothetical protein [Luteolibacter sp.]
MNHAFADIKVLSVGAPSGRSARTMGRFVFMAVLTIINVNAEQFAEF